MRSRTWDKGCCTSPLCTERRSKEGGRRLELLLRVRRRCPGRRVLKVGGRYVCVTLAQSHIVALLLRFFGTGTADTATAARGAAEGDSASADGSAPDEPAPSALVSKWAWAVDIHQVAPAEERVLQGGDAPKLRAFVFCFTKLAHDAAAAEEGRITCHFDDSTSFMTQELLCGPRRTVFQGPTAAAAAAERIARAQRLTRVEVSADVENAPHSKRFAALKFQQLAVQLWTCHDATPSAGPCRKQSVELAKTTPTAHFD